MQKIALVHPGQGCQYVGMCKTLFEDYMCARQVFEEANDVLGYDLKKICFEGSLLELNKIENVFLAILTASVAAFRVYMEEIGIKPVLSAGHSLGEYTALTCNGVLDFKDALKIVRVRSLLSQELTGVGSLAVVSNVYKNVVENECSKISKEGFRVNIACYNSAEQVVISGHTDAIDIVADRLAQIDAQVTPILMSPPFHSPLMKNTAERFKTELDKYTFHTPQWPVLSNVTSLPTTDPERIKKNLVLQLTEPVQWASILDYFEEQGIETIIEIGPQAVLSNLVKENKKSMNVVSFGQKDDRQALLELMSMGNPAEAMSAEVVEESPPTLITRCMAVAVCTRNMNWDDEEYRLGVIEPYERIEKLQDELESKGMEPTIEQMREALLMLRSVFKTKKTPKEEQLRRFNQLLDETGTRDLFPEFLEIN